MKKRRKPTSRMFWRNRTLVSRRSVWTPLAAVAAAAIQIIVIIFGHQFNLSLLVFVALSLSLAMLGPGAWSFDARLFGRQRLI
jgi:predicted cobalt transporter CbtA